MNTHKQILNACRQKIDGLMIDETLMAKTHARLLARLEAVEGPTWQEVIDAPVETVWQVAAASAAHFYRHLPDVVAVSPIEDGDRSHWCIEREIAGVVTHRVGEILIDVDRSMICASDLDTKDLSANGTLPTIYSLTLHEHPTEPGHTVIALAAVTLGLYNPWLLAALSHQCRSIRETIAAPAGKTMRFIRTQSERFSDRPAIAGASAR